MMAEDKGPLNDGVPEPEEQQTEVGLPASTSSDQRCEEMLRRVLAMLTEQRGTQERHAEELAELRKAIRSVEANLKLLRQAQRTTDQHVQVLATRIGGVPCAIVNVEPEDCPSGVVVSPGSNSEKH